jgi:nitrilase
VLYICPRQGCLGKRRKVMPTGSERLVWAQGSPSTLRAVTTTIKGVKLTMASAICWENMMPLLRFSLYSQNVNLWLAPTADARPTWHPLMQTVGNEGRCFVLSAISCVKKKNLPSWTYGIDTTQSAVRDDKSAVINGAASSPSASQKGHSRRRSTVHEYQDHELVLPTTNEEPSVSPTEPAGSHTKSQSAGSSDPSGEEFACIGGSCIIGPRGETLVEPLWQVEDGGLLVHDADFEDCERGRLDLDVAGSYSRNDAFHLTVDGLDISPPP